MKSIKTKMMLVICLLVAVSLSVVGGTVSVMMYNSSIESLRKTMTETAVVAADLVEEYLKTYEAAATEIGLVARLSSADLPVEEKTQILDDKVKQYGFLAGNIANERGQGVLYSVDISDRDYFKQAMTGQTVVSDVLLSKSLNKYTFIVAAPLWEDGRLNTKVVGVVYFNVNVNELSDLTNRIKIGNTGAAYMIDKSNFTIAHKNADLVLNRDNTMEGLKTDPGLASLSALETEMKAGKNGFGTYKYKGVEKILAYAPVNSGQGWSLAVNAELSEFIESTMNAIMITVGLVVLAIIIGIIISVSLANSITKPLIKMEQAAQKISRGDYNVDLSYTSKNEIGSLAQSMRDMVGTTSAIIDDAVRSFDQIAAGNFNVEPSITYIGVFGGIESALRKITADLSDTLQQIHDATNQVASGSEQVSSGAQALAQGATEQASSVEELSASINDVSSQISSNARNANTASELAITAGDGLTQSNKQMESMIGAMSEISTSSSEISKIIKTIEDIAFQTNILALNAAVEAARAGEAGKGFAVVADEVRNLATKSSEAAKQTNVLIEGSVKSVENGVKIAGDTAQSLAEVVVGAQAMAELIVKISAASAEQSTSIAQINLGVEQIASVVQTNSATSEESAAASEELNGQATVMKELVDRFTLKKRR